VVVQGPGMEDDADEGGTEGGKAVRLTNDRQGVAEGEEWRNGDERGARAPGEQCILSDRTEATYVAYGDARYTCIIAHENPRIWGFCERLASEK